MKPIVIYHANCTDGFGAAYAAWRALGDDVEYIDAHYGELDDPATLEERFGSDIGQRDVYILDFSLKRPAMDWLFDKAQRVVWLDHHKTAFEMWCDSELEAKGERDYYTYSSHGVEVLLDNNRSGAMIAWQYFHPTRSVPWIIEHIDDYDRWQFKLSGTKEINKAIWATTPWDFETWNDWVYKFPVAQRAAMIEVGTALLRAYNQQVESLSKYARKCAIFLIDRDFDKVREFGYREGLAVNSPVHMSEIGHVLATETGTFGLIWYMGEGNTVKCSLRSNGDYDVSVIAKQFGGGGHKNAAGFSIDIQTFLGWLK